MTPLGRATDAYYQELLGTAMGALMVQHTTVNAYSDCQAAIRRFRHASNPLGASIGHQVISAGMRYSVAHAIHFFK